MCSVAHRAHEAAVAAFLAACRRRNPERFKRVCALSPVLTHYGWRQIIAHEVLDDFAQR
jgi:hypothetical protein